MRVKSKKSLLTILFLLPLLLTATAQKRPLNHDVYDGWERVGNATLSNDGRYSVVIVREQEGDSYLQIDDLKKMTTHTVERASSGMFTEDCKHLIVRVKPAYAETRQAKIDKLSSEKMPKDSLFIVELPSFKTVKIPSISRYQVAKEASDFFVYIVDDSLKAAPGTPKPNTLVVYNLKSGGQDTIKNVRNFFFDESGSKMLLNMLKDKDDSLSTNRVELYNMPELSNRVLSQGAATYVGLSISKSGDNVAFLATTDSLRQEIKSYSLHHYDVVEGGDSAAVLMPQADDRLPKGWSVSHYRTPAFSESERRLLFGTAPLPMPKDTLTPDFEKATLDIWHWNTPDIPTEELVNLEEKRKENFIAYIDLASGEYKQLGSEEIPNVTILNKSDGDYAVGMSQEEYKIQMHWDYIGRLTNDIWLFDLNSGTKRQIKKGHIGYNTFSPSGRYMVWYQPYEQHYYSYEIATGREVCISEGAETNFWNEEADIPALPGPYGFGMWTENEEYMLAYDAYDIWKLDPTGKKAPSNFTKNVGRDNNIVFRPIKLDAEEDYLPKAVLLRAFNKIDKQGGFYEATDRGVKRLIMEDYKFSNPQKARDRDVMTYTKCDFTISPDIWATDNKWKSERQLTHINPQMEEYLWGSAELVKWSAFDGKETEGILYKPENFDPNKRYPMMVYFYEKMSDQLHEYYYPAPSRSIINFPFYTSRGYIVFVPDIHYKDGHPGESAYNSIVSGVEELMKEPWVDSDNIGIQGQSWGGYQTAYLVTRTNIFKAAGAGAPVSNMFSAYGGIRWGTGISRQYQYEQGQSRIGATIWDAPELYVENSPIFHLPKVETPLLIMHNDNDGAVPWYQGVELFMGMRRLGKPAWLLQYNKEEHNLRERRNTNDLVVRWQQFFDHYLKGEPMPRWMKEGIPSIKKGEEYGFELE